MKRLLFLLLLLLAGNSVAQPLLRNSLSTNDLSTNLVWFPSTKTLRMSGPTPRLSFWNTSAGVDLKRFEIADATSQLRFEWSADNGGSSLLLGTFGTDGNFSPVSLSLSGQTNRIADNGSSLTYNGIPLSTVSVPTTIFLGSLINLTTSTGGKGASLAGNSTTTTWTTNIARAYSQPIFRAGTFSNLVFHLQLDNTGGPLGSGTNMTMILYTNDAPSNFIVTMVTDGATTLTNSGTLSCSVPANTLMSWRITNQVSVSGVDMGWSIEFY